MDDFHDEQLSLFFLHGYGPSRYEGCFTCVEWPRYPVYTIPLSIYTVLVMLGGVFTLALSFGRKLIFYDEM